MLTPDERNELYRFVARNAATEVTAAKVLRCLHAIDEQQLRITELEAKCFRLTERVEEMGKEYHQRNEEAAEFNMVRDYLWQKLGLIACQQAHDDYNIFAGRDGSWERQFVGGYTFRVQRTPEGMYSAKRAQECTEQPVDLGRGEYSYENPKWQPKE